MKQTNILNKFSNYLSPAMRLSNPIYTQSGAGEQAEILNRRFVFFKHPYGYKILHSP